MKKILKEDTFRFDTLDQNKQEKIFDIFKSSYEASVGTSWTKDKFYGRAKNWLFFGDDNGFVTVRPQQSGLYKLTGVAGNLKSILKGLEELQQLNVPVWGMVSKDIQTMANKKGLKTPPGFLVKIMLGYIPKSTFGGVDFDINSDGSVTMKYEDVGDAKKYFVGNDLYFKQIKKDFYPKIKEKISDLPLLARKSIELFLNESKQEIDMNEDITSGSVIVYHRTGSKGGSPVKGISADGYRVGSGATYGVGVYTTYTIESQLKPNMRSAYGNIIIESKVLTMDKFLIFDYDVARKIYGNKNYRLNIQLKLILSKQEWNKYKNDEDLNKLINRLDNVEYSSEVAQDFYINFKNTIIKKLRGIVFTGARDGNVLLSYDRKNVEPLRYTKDEGKTWTNIINKYIYKRKQEYNKENSNSEIEHIKNKLDVGDKLNDDEIEFVLNNQNLLNNLNSYGIIKLLINSPEPQKFADIIINNKNFIKNLNSGKLINLFQNSTEKQKVVNILLSNQSLISILDSDGLSWLLQNSTEKQKVVDILLSNQSLFNNLDSGKLSILLKYSLEPQKAIDIVLSNQSLISILDSYGINYLLLESTEKQKVIDILLSNQSLISNLKSSGISSLLYNSTEKQKVIDKLLSNQTLISNLKSYGIYYLLRDSTEKQKVIDKLLNNKKLIKKLDSDGIKYLLYYSPEPDKVKSILKQYRPDLKLESKMNIKRIIEEEITSESDELGKIISKYKQLQENIKRVKRLML